MKILVLAAFEPELAFVAQAIAAEPALAASITTNAVGIGLLHAALGADAAVREHSPERVVLIGTCGAYLGDDRELATVGDVLAPRSTALADLALDTGVGAGLPGSFEPVVLNEQLSNELRAAAGNPSAPDVATTLAITTDDALARSRGERFALEHLELVAVAKACEKRGVPFAALLGVANRCGSTARTEWLANHTAVERATGEALLRFLRTNVEMSRR